MSAVLKDDRNVRVPALHGFSIGVDIGGTFTDCVVVDAEGRVYTGKVPTTPSDRSQGFFGSIEIAAQTIGLSLGELLERAERIVHGTTTGTNALVARHGAKLGLITTAGHGDVMFLMRGSGRTSGLPPDELLDVPATDKPQALVPKWLIREVKERVDVDGDIVVALDEIAVREAALALAESGVEAICISFLWSIKNPIHERRAREIVREVAPHLYVSCGSDLVVRLGEYERTTTGLMNAYIGPLMLRYIGAIEAGARQRGYGRDVLFAQCAGGAITGQEAREAPIRTVQSGPVAGIVSSVFLAQQTGHSNLIAADMGGTTFDVSVIRGAEPLQRSVSVFQRYELALPMLDVESIGAGGGSIAWLDASGRLNVGPHSAGADPGPACYGRGMEPTVTDADIVLGVLDAERFLGGRMKLDARRSFDSISMLGAKLGLSVYETAAGIVRIVDAKMADLIRRMSVMRGFDPRNFACLAFGGGGPVHCAAVAREANMQRMIVPLPRAAAVWSAFGAATADVAHVYQEAALIELPADPQLIASALERLRTRGIKQLTAEKFDEAVISLRSIVRMKYTMQVHDVEVPVETSGADGSWVSSIIDDFERIYEELFGRGSGYREGGVQITGFEVRAVGQTSKPPLRRLGSSPSMASVEKSSRKVYWHELNGIKETPVLQVRGDIALEPLVGPALIELPDTVVVVRPGQRAHVDEFGNLVVDV